VRRFELRYGKGSLGLEIDAPELLGVITGCAHPAVPDLSRAYREALDHPIDAPPLRELVRPGERVAVAVSDITRVWQRNDLTLPVLLETLNAAGVPDENVTVIVAVGGHRLNSAEEHLEICGETVCHRVRVVNHDAFDAPNMVRLGRTSRGTEVAISRLAREADRLILTGGAVYHYMAGYGGGRKSVLPGIAAIETIRQNHLLGLSPEAGRGSHPQCASRVRRGNPLHEDMMEIAGFVQPDFLVNIVPNLEGEVAGVFAGNWVSAWNAATDLVDRIFGVEIDALADIVVASAGGYPRDINLYQTGKTMDNACHAMRPGGAAVILSECRQVRDPETFFKWFGYPSIAELDRALRAGFHLDGWVAMKQLECGLKGRVILVTLPENVAVIRAAGLTAVSDLNEAMRMARGACGTETPKITVMPQASLTLPVLRR
jgi:nickel-dependent lactate racemase